MTNFQIPNPADIPDGFTLQWDAAAGRFLAVAFPVGAASEYAYIYSTADIALAQTSDWLALSSAANQYATGILPVGFTLDTTTGVLTYTGSGGIFRIQPIFTPGSDGNPIFLAISVNGELIGGNASARAQGEQKNSLGNGGQDSPCARIVELATNDTVQGIYMLPGDVGNLLFYTLDIQKLS